MADESVGTAQFGEFVKRIDERFEAVDKRFDAQDRRIDERFDAQDKRIEEGFAHANQLADQRHDSINQRLADADKAREQNQVHVNQRFDALEKRMDLFHADMLQMRNWLVRLYALVAFGFIGAIALILLKDVIFK